MKVKVFFSFVLFVLWGVVSKIIDSYKMIAMGELAVKQFNNSDIDFIAFQSWYSFINSLPLFVNITFIGILFLMWFSIIKKIIKGEQI